MRKTVLLMATLALGVGGYPTAGAGGGVAEVAADIHSDNMRLVDTFDDGGEYRQGSDLAFWGNRAVLGMYDNPGGFRVLNLRTMREIGQFDCPGRQADVAIWKKLVVVSVDTPRTGPKCGAPAASAAQIAAGQGWEGIRIVSIANPRKPKQLTTVATDCGSHTHTLVPQPGKGRLLVYVSSYPLTGHHGEDEAGNECGRHGKISVVRIPLRNPRQAKVVNEPSTGNTIGCHDITVLRSEKLAAAACISESQIWDISDPVNPVTLSTFRDMRINIHHSSAFSFDGDTVVIGDELGGAVATPGCTGGNFPVGALWFWDISDRTNPVMRSYWRIPREEASPFCTAHNFNVLPMRTKRDILVSAWYNGGTTVVDFTDPANPREIAYYNAKEGTQSATWSSHWYRGRIYANNFDVDVNSVTPRSRGLDVFEVDAPFAKHVYDLRRLNPQTQEKLPRQRRR